MERTSASRSHQNNSVVTSGVEILGYAGHLCVFDVYVVGITVFIPHRCTRCRSRWSPRICQRTSANTPEQRETKKGKIQALNREQWRGSLSIFSASYARLEIVHLARYVDRGCLPDISCTFRPLACLKNRGIETQEMAPTILHTT